ncbi:MAG TPA: response regulator transcription factor [Dermatophilaceae bacterium]|nr:response regulator transcription factor [Dermatophilaceae bacterium]
MRARVLVVDDEPHIRTLLRAYLERDGYAVLEASTGTAALGAVAGSDAPDLLLLDIGLPDVDGLEVLRRLRATSAVPVILVTARAEEVDTLVGLSVGADDYVTKPFSPREVVARVKTVLRRVTRDDAPSGSPPAPDGTHPTDQRRDEALSFVGLVIDPARREVHVDHEAVHLSALEFDVLAALASSPGRVFSRAQLLERVWGYDFFGDERVVDVHIRSIRKALGDDVEAPRFIGTVRGVGYKLVAVVPGGPS